jgi:hypothetical protein
MADFSSSRHHSLLKNPAAFATVDTSTPNLSSFLLYNQTSHGKSPPAPGNASAAMLEDASLESSSAVLDSQQGSASVDRKRKANDESATLSSAHSKVLANN